MIQDSYRTRIRLLAARGLSHAEIARRLNVSTGKVGYALRPQAPDYDAARAAAERRANPDFDRDPIWLGMRTPGVDA